MHRPPARIRAFSLVEVVLALGLVSFSLITVMGLTLVGFTNFQRAINTTTETEIAQNLANQLQETSYTNITAACSSNYYFTQEGLPTNVVGSLYTVSMMPPTNCVLPSTGAPVPSTNLTTVVFDIVSKNAPSSTNVIQVYIPNFGS